MLLFEQCSNANRIAAKIGFFFILKDKAIYFSQQTEYD